MSRPLPELADPVRLCTGGRRFAGVVPLTRFERLGDRLVDDTGELRFELEFARDERNINVARGWLETELSLSCERCGEPFELPVRCEWQLGVVQSLEEADRLPEDCEPLLVGEAQTRLMDILEDELLLALPLVPRHPGDESCSVSTDAGLGDQKQEEESPFAVLKTLRDRDKDSGE